MNSLMFIFFGVILVFGITIFVLVVTRGRGTSVLDVDRFRSSWLAIEKQLVSGQSSSYTVVVMEADKLLDFALKQRGFKGDTMGQRMKAANDQWSNANNVWRAHKLRNRLAHEPGASVSNSEARGALTHFRQGLKDLGAI